MKYYSIRKLRWERATYGWCAFTLFGQIHISLKGKDRIDTMLDLGSLKSNSKGAGAFRGDALSFFKTTKQAKAFAQEQYEKVLEYTLKRERVIEDIGEGIAAGLDMADEE